MAKADPVAPVSKATPTASRPVGTVDDSAKCDPVRMKEALMDLRYPPEYMYSKGWNKSQVEHATMMRMLDREKENQTSLVVAYGDKEKTLRTRCQAVPSPLDIDDKHRDKIWMYVVSPQVSSITKRITLDELPKWEAEGWKEFHVAEDCLVEGTDFETRKIPLIQDVYTTDNPVNDTLRIFKTGVAMSEKSDGITWTTERLLTSQDGVQAIVATSKGFIGPNDHEHRLVSAISRGHHIKYPRPGKVGPGWGDYDHYQEWQAQGRKVTSDMVPEKICDNSTPEVVEFEIITDEGSVPGDRVNTVNKMFDEGYDENISNLMGLWERLKKDEGRNVNRLGRTRRRQ
ncbi:hypothetical protein FAUST_11089 [Fusarium austroamericanum]|uniref:Uncharacterized protein n=1 Tax=Fusarium austroamericanum TaxID=282268 RepID=A0AAN5YZP0_FUSAU|nr:hypothetical protein FAUST_11089 [Fusarium austroamericanum]